MSFFKPSVSLLLIYSAIIASLTKVWAAELITQCKPGYVAITYDDGPYQYTSELINLLDREGVKATFFVNGQNFWDLEANTDAQDVIRKAYIDGHQIASHTWSHAALDELADFEFDEQIDKLEDYIYAIIGERPAFIRPPYGQANEITAAKLDTKGYNIVIWSTDTRDFESHNLKSERANFEESMTDLSSGYITLSHDVYQQTTTQLTKAIIRHAKKLGFKFCTVAECIGATPYK